MFLSVYSCCGRGDFQLVSKCARAVFDTRTRACTLKTLVQVKTHSDSNSHILLSKVYSYRLNCKRGGGGRGGYKLLGCTQPRMQFCKLRTRLLNMQTHGLMDIWSQQRLVRLQLKIHTFSSNFDRLFFFYQIVSQLQ